MSLSKDFTFGTKKHFILNSSTSIHLFLASEANLKLYDVILAIIAKLFPKILFRDLSRFREQVS